MAKIEIRTFRNGEEGELDKALARAVKSGGVEEVRRLIEQGAKPSAYFVTEFGWGEAFSPVLHIALGRSLVITELLLNAGAEIGAANWLGENALHRAALYDQPATVELLLRHYAVFGEEQLARLINSKDRVKGWTPLHCAVLKSKSEVVELLLKHGADTKIRDCYDLTALMLASKRSNYGIADKGKCLSLLLDLGEELDAAEVNKMLYRGYCSDPDKVAVLFARGYLNPYCSIEVLHKVLEHVCSLGMLLEQGKLDPAQTVFLASEVRKIEAQLDPWKNLRVARMEGPLMGDNFSNEMKSDDAECVERIKQKYIIQIESSLSKLKVGLKSTNSEAAFMESPAHEELEPLIGVDELDNIGSEESGNSIEL